MNIQRYQGIFQVYRVPQDLHVGFLSFPYNVPLGIFWFLNALGSIKLLSYMYIHQGSLQAVRLYFHVSQGSLGHLIQKFCWQCGNGGIQSFFINVLLLSQLNTFLTIRKKKKGEKMGLVMVPLIGHLMDCLIWFIGVSIKFITKTRIMEAI